jgi:hypothetical protein
MAERNVGREIALILGATVVLGGGLAAYILSTIEKPEPIGLAPSARDPIASSANHNADEMRALASRWGDQLRARDYAAVHSAMAEPFRARVSVEQLAAMVAENPYLAGSEGVTVLRTTEQRAGTDPTSASLRARGLLQSKNGSVEVTLHFVREPDGLRIASVLLAGVPVLQGVAPAAP